MASMNISLPEQMRDWVQMQINGGAYSSSSDYVRDLIRRDQERKTKLQTLQAAITAGAESGDAGELDIAAIKRTARKKAGLDTK